MSPTTIVLAIVLAIGSLGAVAYWDEGREAKEALGDFAVEQATLARGVAASLELRAAPQLDPIVLDAVALRAAFAPVADPDTLALVRGPGEATFTAATGSRFRLAALEPDDSDACSVSGPDRSRCWRRLERAEAVALGLPERTAMAGFSGFTDKSGERWRVVVVASARRPRDRDRRATWRLVLGFAVSSGLVLAFGTLALQRQRRQLALARELAVSEAVRARDERLVRADKLATMGAMAIGIAHEVSTPLGVILGRAEQLLLRTREDPRDERAARIIVEQTQRIGAIVRGLLTMARGGAPALERVAPEALATAAVDLVRHRFEPAGVSLRLAAAGGLPQVACDGRLVEQALVNLLLNACDACARGGHVELLVERANDGVAFVVIDDGEGIGAQAALRATEPFFTTKPEGRGTGLGLAIAREIVSHHHGKLSLAPRAGAAGTEARIVLPA